LFVDWVTVDFPRCIVTFNTL